MNCKSACRNCKVKGLDDDHIQFHCPRILNTADKKEIPIAETNHSGLGLRKLARDIGTHKEVVPRTSKSIGIRNDYHKRERGYNERIPVHFHENPTDSNRVRDQIQESGGDRK